LQSYLQRDKILKIAGMKELYDKDRDMLEQRERMKRMKEGRDNLNIIKKKEGRGVVPIGAMDELNLDNVEEYLSEMPRQSKSEDATAIYNEDYGQEDEMGPSINDQRPEQDVSPPLSPPRKNK
jgi:hypothetical protein